MSGLFKTPKMPEVAKPTPMPDPQDPVAIAARRRAVAKETATQGVTSTVLSAGGRETLGG
jgi:hypothetical protein